MKVPKVFKTFLLTQTTGTDHPFFPPLEEGEDEWLSVKLNTQAVQSAFGGDQKAADAVMGSNAKRVLRLPD